MRLFTELFWYLFGDDLFDIFKNTDHPLPDIDI